MKTPLRVSSCDLGNRSTSVSTHPRALSGRSRRTRRHCFRLSASAVASAPLPLYSLRVHIQAASKARSAFSTFMGRLPLVHHRAGNHCYLPQPLVASHYSLSTPATVSALTPGGHPPLLPAHRMRVSRCTFASTFRSTPARSINSVLNPDLDQAPRHPLCAASTATNPLTATTAVPLGIHLHVHTRTAQRLLRIHSASAPHMSAPLLLSRPLSGIHNRFHLRICFDRSAASITWNLSLRTRRHFSIR